MESTSGMETRNRKPSLNLMESRIQKRTDMVIPSSKPVPLISVSDYSKAHRVNGIVLDGFLGSASTLIACDQIGRIC